MERVFNFSAGPSTLPLAVLEKVSKELINTNNRGMSVMEMSHRSQAFLDIIKEAESLLRQLMSFPTIIKYYSCRAVPPNSHGAVKPL